MHGKKLFAKWFFVGFFSFDRYLSVSYQEKDRPNTEAHCLRY